MQTENLTGPRSSLKELQHNKNEQSIKQKIGTINIHYSPFTNCGSQKRISSDVKFKNAKYEPFPVKKQQQSLGLSKQMLDESATLLFSENCAFCNVCSVA